MHLQPARYNPPQLVEPPLESLGQPSTRLFAWQQQEQKKSSLSASSASTVNSLIDNGGAGGSSSNGGSGSFNNNNQAIQFMAGGQSYSPANTVNGKLNGELNLLPGQRYNSNVKTLLSMSDTRPYSFNNTIDRNNNNNSAMNFSKHDKIKLMELSIINLVELSTMAAEEGKQELALERAREALEGFNSLKVAVMAQQNRLTGVSNNNKLGHHNKNKAYNDPNEFPDTFNVLDSDDYRESAGSAMPVTTGVSLYGLSLMINSNLAAQLANNGHLEESIELYTQLCKMASGGSNHQATMDGLSKEQLETRFVLYRFGLNIGNIYYGMQEYQRALKYYRLTLDRLSVSSAYKNLKIKIMHNIALTLMAMGQLSESATSLNMLLLDNLTTTHINEPSAEVCNSNHHEFGLNLMVCHHQRADLNSMMTTLKSLVKVGVCQQYDRVFDLTANATTSNSFMTAAAASAMARRDDVNDGRQSSGSSSSTMTAAPTAASSIQGGSLANQSPRNRHRDGNIDESSPIDAAAKMIFDQTFGTQTIKTADKGGRGASSSSSFLGAVRQQTIAESNKQSSITGRGLGDMEIEKGKSDAAMDMYTNENSRRLLSRGLETTTTSASQPTLEQCGTRLTKLSTAEKSRQLMRLIQDDRLEKLIGDKHNQISRSLIMGCNLMLDLDNRIALSNQQHSVDVDTQNRTSVLEFCLKLLATSECYKSLVDELKANCASEMLRQKFKLDEAIAVLKGMDQEQQVDKKEQQRDKAIKSAVKNLINRNNTSNNKNFNTNINQSSMVATNCSLLNLLQCNKQKAMEYANQALKVDKFNVHALINLANCHYLANELDAAEALYNQALLIKPINCEANYNLALLNRKQQRHYNELKESTKAMLTKYRQCSSTLIWHKMILPVIQLALVYHHSKLQPQSHNIISNLLSSSKQAPDILLLASRLLDDSSNRNSSKKPDMSLLQQAHKDFPYHLPVAERLIALNIQSFNYEQARAILSTCIINRPDQAKWYQMLAECYRRAADYNKAIAVYKIAIDTFPQDTSCLKALIKLTEELGLNEEKKNYTNKLERTLRRIDLSENTV